MPDAAASLTELGTDMEALASLFVPGASVHVLGRSLPVEEFVRRLGELLTGVDRPRLDVVRIEEAAVAPDPLSLTCAAEVSLIDRRTQHLGTVTGELIIRVTSRAGTPGSELTRPEPSELLIHELSFQQAA